MGFIVGRAYPIIQSMAKKGDKKAQALIDRLDSMTQDEVDSEVSAIMGGSKKGGSKKSEGSKDGKPQLKGKEQKTLTKKSGEKATLEKTVVPIMPRGGLSKEQQAELDSEKSFADSYDTDVSQYTLGYGIDENTPKSFTDVAKGQGEVEGSPKQKLSKFVNNQKEVYDNFNVKAAEMEQSQPGLSNFQGLETALKSAEEEYNRLGIQGESMDNVPAKLIKKQGGVTVKNNQMIEPTKGYQVSYDKESEVRLDITGDGVQQVEEALSLVKEMGIKDYGIWFDGEKNQVVLDPSSTWIKDRLTMAQLATIGDQDSIVNWEESALQEEMIFEGREEYAKTFGDDARDEDGQDNSMKGKFEKLQKDIKFDRSVVTFEQMEKVANELGIGQGTTQADLQNMRDGIVEAWAESPNRRENEDGRAAMSAITATIDYMMRRSNKEMGEEFAAMKTDKEVGPTVSEGEKANRQVMGQMGIDNPEEVAGGVSESEEIASDSPTQRKPGTKGALYERITSQMDGDFDSSHFYDLEDDAIGITPNPGSDKYDATLFETSQGQWGLSMFMDGEELSTDSLDYFDTPEEAAEYALDTDNYEELKTANLEMEDLQDIDDGENAEMPPEMAEEDVEMGAQDEPAAQDAQGALLDLVLKTDIQSPEVLQDFYEKAKRIDSKMGLQLAEEFARRMKIKLKK